MRQHFLHRAFEPRSIAVVGASEREDAVGRQILDNLQQAGYSGDIYAVNPNRTECYGRPCFPSLHDIDHSIDLVIITIPSRDVPKVMRACGELSVGGVIVISAGFGEHGKAGRTLQDEVADIARTYKIPLFGPNCLGLVRPGVGLNASFIRSPVNTGHVALVAQSSAFTTALLDWAASAGFGFSLVASLGATAGVNFGEVLDYLSLDPQTRSILVYVEGINEARAFISGLRAAARLKPVIVVKSGRSENAGRMEVAHGSALPADDEVFDAAIQRAGAVRVHTVTQLFAAAATLASGTRVFGPRLAILTNGAGPGVMAADHAHDTGVELAQLSEAGLQRLSEVLPAHWRPSSPLDILGDADGERYRASCEILLQDKQVDAVLVLLTPQGMTDPEDCAKGVITAAADSRKPVLACWMGQNLVRSGRILLEQAGIPQFPNPEGGVDGFGYLAAYRRNQDALLQAPPPLPCKQKPDVAGARLIIQHALDEQRRLLSVTEAKAVLRAFRIPVNTSINATSAADALVAAQSLGLPVAMKINSPDVMHKSDAGGVRLNIDEPHSVRRAYLELRDAVQLHDPDARISGVSVETMIVKPHAREIRIAIGHDAAFGPVIHFGIGGNAVEAYDDSCLALPPLNEFLCRDLIQRTRASRLLSRLRSLPEADMPALIGVLQRVSEIACELPEVVSLEINPLLVDEDGVIAVDAAIAVAPPRASTAHYGHMAIHPYPPELESIWHMADGTDITIRPIRPEDSESERTFVEGMSEESRYFRFMNLMKKLSPLMLARFTQIDYDREMALVAVLNDGADTMQILGVARYVGNPDIRSCEFALAVADEWQKKGVGRELMQRLMTVARDRGLGIMEGDVLANNRKMLRFCARLGFRATGDSEDAEIVVVRRHL